MIRQRGFVLVNALVLVTALAGVAVVLLARAGTGQAQLAATAQGAQLEAYLDAFEVLALAVIDGDPGAVDHPGEAWARAEYNVPLDRGRVAGGLRDMQAGFNVNLLANLEDTAALAALGRMAGRLGVSSQTSAGIIAAVSSRGQAGQGLGDRPQQLAGVESQMPGGALALIEQLPLPDRDRARLAPYLVALPGDALINVNTASEQVLAAFLPDLGRVALDKLIQERKRTPFRSVEAFHARLAEDMDTEAMEALAQRPRFAVGSDWFAAEITAELEGRLARRHLVLRRLPLPHGAEVAYRLDRW